MSTDEIINNLCENACFFFFFDPFTLVKCITKGFYINPV